MLQDLHHAVRQCFRKPGLAIVAILTLTLGLGVNTAMFGLADALILRRAPYEHPEQLLRVFASSPVARNAPLTQVEVDALRENAKSFASVAAFAHWQLPLQESGRPTERVNVVRASADLFATFAIRPALGRPFSASDVSSRKDDLVVLSHDFWVTRFAADPAIVGRQIVLDSHPATIIGVLPASADYQRLWGKVDVWRPLVFAAEEGETREKRWLHAVARLRENASQTSAASEVAVCSKGVASVYPDSSGGWSLATVGLERSLVGSTHRLLTWLLLALAGIVLAIACANLVLLQLSRIAPRSREFAIRRAIGAADRYIARSQLVENLLLATISAGLALLVANWTTDLLQRTFAASGTLVAGFELNLRVLGFTVLVAAVSGILVSLLPVWIAARTPVAEVLRRTTTKASGSRALTRLRHGLVVTEIAFALILLSGALFVARGLQKHSARDLGWHAESVQIATLNLPDSQYPDTRLRRFYEDFMEKLSSSPGVSSAALASSLPTRRFDDVVRIASEPGLALRPSERPIAYQATVTSDFFATLQIPIISGLTFSPTLAPDAPPVVVVSESVARRFWPDKPALGQRLALGESAQLAEVIGVVRDLDFAGEMADPETRLQVYRPMVQQLRDCFQVAVRTSAPLSFETSIRRAVEGIDAGIAVYDVRSAVAQIGVGQAVVRLSNRLIGAFALLGLVLAIVGLYGVVSELVAQRTVEFGIRIAFGADPATLFASVLRQGAALAFLGTLFGTAGAIGIVHVLASLLPRLDGIDSYSLALLALVLSAATILACWIPARRATRVDPMIALRTE